MAEMSLEQRQYLTAKFKEFIAAVHSSHESNLPVRTPYQWQIRLMLYVAEHGYWPRSIGAPTASGKTSVIDIHVFLNAMAGLSLVEGNGLFDLPLRNIPRRLALTVNRRSLVDDQFDEACALQDKMQIEHVANDGLDVYRDGLKLRAAINDRTKSDSAIPRMIAVELRGSISPDREWRYYPQTCAVICATPDMFGSRLLFRGYGTSRTMRSMEAGLLAYDTVLIVDEAHLSQQLLKTAQQVARIENMADAPIARQVSPLQVVETTATPVSEDTDNAISVLESDFTTDVMLEKRLNQSKPVVVTCDFEKSKDEIDAIVEQCLSLIHSNIEADEYSDSGPHVLGCILNTVKKANLVADKLEKLCKKNGIKKPIDVYIGPMRAYDKRKVADKLHSLSELKPDEAPCCIIGTQTLEVGVDIDFANMVTEIAPGSALVQRAGRVNRRGLRSEGLIYIFGVELQKLSEKKQSDETVPYKPEDIIKAQTWLNSLEDAETGKPSISAWSVGKTMVPREDPDRLLIQRLEPWDVENLSVTDENLCANLCGVDLQQGRADLNLWLRDDLNSSGPDINIVVRNLPWNDMSAIRILEMAQPENDELFPVRKWRGLQEFFKCLEKEDNKSRRRGARVEADNEHGGKDKIDFPHRVFRYRASEPEGHRVICMHVQDAEHAVIKSGDILILDDFERVFSTFTENVAIFDPEGSSTVEDVFNKCGSSIMVINDISLKPKEIEAFQHIQKIEEISGEHNAEVLSDKVQNDMQESLRLIRAAAAAESTSSVECSLLCFEREHSCFDVDGNEIIREVRWIVSSASENAPDSESDQEIIVSRKKTLFLGGISNDSNLRRKEGHQDHVAWRAQALGKAVGLDDTLTNDLRIAGEYHDEGKKDRRFQRLLRNDREVQETELWAKSRYFISHAKERGLRNEYRLHGWRHEQRSVAEFLQASKTNERLRDMEETDKQLVARLIGTSHGHGRASFQYGTEYLLPVEGGSSREMNPELNVLSDRLFETGEWETLIDHTNQRYGFWGVSYLEALLRAADITCSKEGL